MERLKLLAEEEKRRKLELDRQKQSEIERLNKEKAE